MRINNKKGFTLAEMLIVVAIIGVLVAIISVTVTSALEKTREAVDLANIKSAFEELTIVALNETPKADLPNYIYCNKKDGVITSYVTLVKPKQKKNKWQSNITLVKNTYAMVNGAYVGASTIESGRIYKVVYYTTPQPKPSDKSVYEDGYTCLVQLAEIESKYSPYNFYRSEEKVVK